MSDKNSKQLKTVILGATILILTAIGLITVLVSAGKWSYNIINKTSEKEKFERFLLPLVMYDPVPFDKIENADNNMIIQIGIWNTLLNEDKDKYPKNDMDMLLIPDTDVDINAAKIFGKNIKITHQTIGDTELTYYYDAENKVYHVPPTAQIGLYTPKVEKITRSGDTYTLVVGYVPPGSIWEGDIDGNKYRPKPDKYKTYVLKKEKKDYSVTAILDYVTSSIPAGSGSSSSSASSPSSVPLPESQPEVQQQQSSSPSSTTSSAPSSKAPASSK